MASGVVWGRIRTTAKAAQRSNVCACASNGTAKRQPKYFHDIVLLVDDRHPINSIFLVTYTFVYV